MIATHPLRLRGHARWMVPALVLVMAVETVVVTLAAGSVGHGRVLGAALIADLVLLSAVALMLAGGPKAVGLTAKRALRAAVLGVVLFSAVARLAGVPMGNALLPLALAAEATLSTLVVLALLRAFRDKQGELFERLRERLRETLPAPVLAVALFELGILHAAWQALRLRRAEMPAPSETVFPPMSASSSGWVIPFVAIATGVEMTAVHVLLHVFWPGHLWVNLLLAGLNVYGLLWLVGDRRMMQATAHRLEVDELVLSLGARCSARIPYALITRVLPLRTDAERRSVQPKKGRKNPQVTPADPTNVHLCLSAPVRMTTFFGLQREAQHLDLFVDRPEQFIAAIERRRSAQASERA